MMLDKGLVLMSDTRTNAGVDNVSTFRKMSQWSVPGERVIAMMTAGNLATTQSVISQLEERTKAPPERHNSLLEAPTMFQVATLVGKLLNDTILAQRAESGQTGSDMFKASIILAGQIKGMKPRLFNIYAEGNFIEASTDTPFFQIGETKYGRPILVRAYDWGMSFEDAVKLIMVSFDSTVKANLSVGLPLDMLVIERNRFEPLHSKRITADDPYYHSISSGWSEALKAAFHSLPDYEFSGVGRDDGRRAGEYSGIFYQRDRFLLDDADCGTFWLSDTPERVGSKSWGNEIPRVAAWVRLMDRATGRRFYVFNTHWDHRNQPSRERAALLIAGRIDSRKHADEPVALIGDFNSMESNPGLIYLTGGRGAVAGSQQAWPNGLLDTYQSQHPAEKNRRTLHFWSGRRDGLKVYFDADSGPDRVPSPVVEPVAGSLPAAGGAVARSPLVLNRRRPEAGVRMLRSVWAPDR